MPDGAVGKLGASPLRHGANVSNLALSADGKLVASLGWDGKLKVWNVADAKLVYETTGLRDSIDLSTDGKLLTAGGNGITAIHDLTARKALRTVPGIQARLAPDAKLMATTQYDGDARAYKILIIDVDSGKTLRSCGAYASRMEGFAFSPKSERLAAAGADGVVYLWDVTTGKETVRCAGHRATIESVAFTPDGKRLASASHDGTARLWDPDTGKEERCFSRLAANSAEPLTWASRVAFAPDGKRLFVAWSAGATATVIELASGRTILSMRGNTAGGAPIGRVVCGEAQTMASLSGTDGVIHVTDLTTGQELTPAQPAGDLQALAVSNDGRTVALSDVYHSVSLWDVPSGKQRLRLTGLEVAPQTMAFALDGALLATGGSSETVVRLWKVATGEAVRELHGHNHGVRQLWFAADGRSLLAVDSVGVVHRWDAGADKEIEQHWLKRGTTISISADARRALMVNFNQKTRVNEWRLVDVVSGKTLVDLPADVGGTLLPDGQQIAAFGPGAEKSLRLWSAGTGRLLRRINTTLNEPPANERPSGGSFLAITPDGRSIAGAQGTRTARLWEAATGLERLRLAGHATPIRSASLSPDGRMLVTSGGDATVLVWDLFSQQGAAPKQPLPADLETHWNSLMGTDGRRAFASVCLLARSPAQSVPYLKERLKPLAPADPQVVARLLADLDSKDFTARQKASDELEKLGDLAEDALRKAMDGKPALEISQRIEKLLDKLESQQLTADQMRALRAIEVLELIATPEARQVIESVAKGAPGARLTREARAALGRIAR
ncbi:MAG: WD40 repeat domain-containing protein [Gemmataceae bacterium]|nr:WD40 repeat domain-containing protein [Gemmataceae bacterium]